MARPEITPASPDASCALTALRSSSDDTPPETITGIGTARAKRRGGRDIRATQEAVAVDVGMNNGGYARVDEPAGEIGDREFRGFGPAFGGDFTGAGIDADGDLAGKALRAPGGTSSGFFTAAVPRMTRATPAPSQASMVGQIANAAAKLDRHRVPQRGSPRRRHG